MAKKRLKDCTTWDEHQTLKKQKRSEYKARRAVMLAGRVKKIRKPCSQKKINDYIETKSKEPKVNIFSDSINSVDLNKKLPF